MNIQKFKDILFPKFSEADAFALIVSSFLLIADKKEKIIRFFMNDPDPRYLIIMAAVAYWIFIVFKNVLSRKQITKDDKMWMAKIYFLVIGLMSFISAMQYLFRPSYGYSEKVNIFDAVNLLIVFSIFIHSLISLGVLRVWKNEGEKLVSQVTDDQATYFDLILILSAALLSYFAVTRFYSPANAILLTFYYSTVLAKIIKSASGRILNFTQKKTPPDKQINPFQKPLL